MELQAGHDAEQKAAAGKAAATAEGIRQRDTRFVAWEAMGEGKAKDATADENAAAALADTADEQNPDKRREMLIAAWTQYPTSSSVGNIIGQLGKIESADVRGETTAAADARRARADQIAAIRAKVDKATKLIAAEKTLLENTLDNDKITAHRGKIQSLTKTLIDAYDEIVAILVPPAPTQPVVPSVASQADFDALPSGSEFIGPDGMTRRKP